MTTDNKDTRGELRERIADAIRSTGHVTNSQKWDVADAVIAALSPAIAPAGPNIAAAWHKARNAWMKFSRNSTQAAGDAAAIAALTTALNAAPQDGAPPHWGNLPDDFEDKI